MSSPFPKKPLNTTNMNRLIKRYPAIFGVPFVLLMVGASFGLATFTQTRYDLHDQRVQQVSKEDALKLDKNRKKFDIREEYFRLTADIDDNWEPKRIKRPEGLPEWGVLPEETPPPLPLEPVPSTFKPKPKKP